MSISRGTVHSIQFLRFVAATLVVVFHAHLALSTRLLGSGTTTDAYLFGFGASGVHIFFVISGYIMYLTNFGREGRFAPGQFLVRRLIRIYPVYWIFALLYVVAHLALGSAYAIVPPQWIGALLLWPADAPLIIGPSWTLSYELYFYLVFGLIMVAGAWRGSIALTLIFALSVAIGLVLRPADPLPALMTNALLLEFVAGVWIARLTLDRRWPRRLGWVAAFTAVAGFGAGLAYGYDRLPSALAWGAPSALLVLGFVVLERSGGVPGTRRASVLGDSSYALYLCHILLIDLAIAGLRLADARPAMAIVLPAVTLGCIVFAHLFHLIVERPLMRVLHRHIPSPRRSPALPAATNI